MQVKTKSGCRKSKKHAENKEKQEVPATLGKMFARNGLGTSLSLHFSLLFQQLLKKERSGKKKEEDPPDRSVDAFEHLPLSYTPQTRKLIQVRALADKGKQE